MIEILKKAQGYTYNSLNYLDLDEIEINPNEDLIIEQSDAIIICNKTIKEYKMLWAAETLDAFTKAVGELGSKLNYIFSNGPRRISMEFVRPEFIPVLESLGFRNESQFVDFWIDDISKVESSEGNTILIRNTVPEDYLKVSLITKACKGLSRGFHGEEVEFIKEWNEDENSCILLAELEGAAVGVCFVNIYGFNSEKGPVLWIRELAVDPNFQNRGIGRSLIEQGLQWGLLKGAKRSFLAVDKQNIKAIHLYNQFGYKCKDEIGQINMALEVV
ncbi:GNAT superfamily N-acetyltransferase [Paenibacillus anaericanus]|uniref:GNAT family N-acetyltransferase n=1 Tax=Paenibacillus anaericanus TaxID=170367 RepID=UPI00277E9B8E|nr:GNAT family N-acetyltransferase [Paenibacillus anaericanus]MDQ0087626.1 GNAT superfamily N-acetyltransferase [Paenibacillus anaericanus]